MNKLKIMTHADRVIKGHFVKMAIFGPPGIGKTSLLKTLEEPTLCIDLEAGMLSVQDWDGDSVGIRTWEEARNIACLLGGPNPALGDKDCYSKRDYERLSKEYANPALFEKYSCIFIDSITVASRLCFKWAQLQPEALNKYGKLDTRAAYGLLGREMTAWITQLQHITNKDIIMVGLLDKKSDEDNKTLWMLQCEGNKTALEIPGILDEVLCMIPFTNAQGKIERKFVCHVNSDEYPAKDRSGKLDLYEEAHLGDVLKKIKSISILDDPNMFVFTWSNGQSKVCTKDNVEDYLCGMLNKLERLEQFNNFKSWMENNKSVFEKYKDTCGDSYKKFTELFQIKLEAFNAFEAQEQTKKADTEIAYNALLKNAAI